MKTALVHSDEWARFDYGPEHPLRMERLGLTWRLMDAYGLTALPNVRLVAPTSPVKRSSRAFTRASISTSSRLPTAA